MTKLEEAGIIYKALVANLANKKEVLEPERYRWRMSEDVLCEIEEELHGEIEKETMGPVFVELTKLCGIPIEGECEKEGTLELWEKIGEVPRI